LPLQPLNRSSPPATIQSWLRPELILSAMIGVYVVVFGWLTWLQQANFGTFDFDMGVFDQEIWLAARHQNPFITIRGLNMWANHVNPIIYLLVPFYWLGAGPHFLYLVQTLAFAGSAIPLWLLARDRFANPWLSLGIPLAWLLYPAVEWMTWWPFHPEYLAVPAFLFAYWFADRGRWGWYALCLVLVLACKEDTALPIMALGILLAFRHHRRAGLVTVAGALAWFFLCVEVIVPGANAGLAPFYLYQYSAFGNSMGHIIWNVLRHPSRVWSLALQHDRLHYYVQLLGPVAGLALLAPATLFLAVPTLLVNVLNNQGYPYQIKYQYSAFVAAGIFLAVIEGIGRYRSHRLRHFRVGMVVILCIVALVSNVAWSPSPLDATQYRSGIWNFGAGPRVRELEKMVRMVPADAGVAASLDVVPHLSHRDQIYSWPNPWIRSNYGVTATQPSESPDSIQYIILDTTENTSAEESLISKLTKPGGPFHIILQRDQALLATRVRSASGN